MKLIPFILSAVVSTTAIYAQVPYPGNDAACGVTQTAGFLDAYTGNMAFSTTDIVVAGAVGGRGLTFQRFTTSRTSQKENLFGLGHNWAHNWQWEMVDAGRDSQGRAVLSVRVPGGWVHRFTETSPGQWWPEPSEQHRLLVKGNSYTILHRDGGEIRFTRSQAANGIVYTLREITDGVGNLWTITWNAGQLVRITEPAGRWLEISYSALSASGAAATVKPYSVISGVTASDGQKVSYNYIFPSGTDYPVLTTVDYADGTKGSYTYAAPRAGTRLLLSSVDDPHAEMRVRGRSFHFRSEPDAAFGQLAQAEMTGSTVPVDTVTADKSGLRSYAIKQENGATVYRNYNPGGNIAQEIDPLGFARSYEYDAAGRGFKTSETDELGKITRYDRDSRGKVLKTTFPNNSTRSWQRDTEGRVSKETNELGQTRSYIRDAQGRVTKVQQPDGNTSEIAYNNLGQPVTIKTTNGATTSVDYDSRGLCAKVTNALGATVSQNYDEHDRVAVVTDAHGNSTRLERDASGRVTKVIYADNSSSSVTYNSYGQVVKTVDATDSARTFVYDLFGRKTSAFDSSGHETQFEYATLGQGPFGQPTSVTSPEGRISTKTFDAKGRVVAQTIAAGTLQAATTRFAYDARGRKTSVTNARNQTVQYFYDDRGRPVKVMNALNNATTRVFDATGHKLSETDAKGNTTKWTYDSAGRELTKTDAKDQTITKTYDTAGRLATLTDPKGSVYRFEYDLLGRPTALVYSDGSRETTTYDIGGNKLTYTNRAGVTQSFAYDNRNREILSQWSDGSQRIAKTYDAAGRMIQEDNGVSKLSYGLDTTGRLISETQYLSSIVTGGASDLAPRTVSYTYTDDGQRDALIYPDDSFIKYTYNARGQLESILGDGVPPPIASYEYDLAGNATLMPRGNDTETELAYDAGNRVSSIVETAQRSPLSELDYTYDGVDNRTSTTQTINANEYGHPRTTVDTYRYDETYQVTGADFGTKVNSNGQMEGRPENTERFTYDEVGNRLTVKADGRVTRYTVNALNEYTRVGEFAPAYDRNGNLSAMNDWLYHYDALNRLVEATNGRMTAKFYYDAKNRCVARSYNGVTTLNYYDKWNLIEELDTKGNEIARYVHGRKIDEIVVMVNRSGTFYPHRDVLGNVTMLTDKDGKLVERYSYSVTGVATIFDAKGRELQDSAVGNRWLFTGREWLKEVGLYDYRNRVYSAELGRFMQNDPIRLTAGDINIYRYVSNRYSNYTDPTGQLLVGAIVDGIIGAASGWAGAATQGASFWGQLGNAALGGLVGAGIGAADITDGIVSGAIVSGVVGGVRNLGGQAITYYDKNGTMDGFGSHIDKGSLGAAVAGGLVAGAATPAMQFVLQVSTAPSAAMAEMVAHSLCGLAGSATEATIDDVIQELESDEPVNFDDCVNPSEPIVLPPYTCYSDGSYDDGSSTGDDGCNEE